MLAPTTSERAIAIRMPPPGAPRGIVLRSSLNTDRLTPPRRSVLSGPPATFRPYQEEICLSVPVIIRRRDPDGLPAPLPFPPAPLAAVPYFLEQPEEVAGRKSKSGLAEWCRQSCPPLRRPRCPDHPLPTGHPPA